jgi:hypothetical protein
LKIYNNSNKDYILAFYKSKPLKQIHTSRVMGYTKG